MERYLRFPEVKKITGLSRATIFRLERAGKFPKRKNITHRLVGWLSSDIEEWVKSRIPVSFPAAKLKQLK